MARSRRSNRASLARGALACTLCTSSGIALAADPAERNVQFHVGAAVMEDDNLYRVPKELPIELLLGPKARRNERVASTSLAVTGRWEQARQEVALDAMAAANRYAYNDDLDNSSGYADLQWNWEIGRRWSGELGGRRDRSLASFINTRNFDKDLIDTAGIDGEARFSIAARWEIFAGGREATTEHSNEARRINDNDTSYRRAGFRYRTPRGSSVSIESRNTEADFFAEDERRSLSTSDYDERMSSVSVSWVLTSKMRFAGSTGHVSREYPRAEHGNFSGNVWSAALQWVATDTFSFSVRRAHELKAYIDAESDHFVSTGTTLTAAWMPLPQLQIGLNYGREKQQYIGDDAALIDTDARRDRPTSRGLRVTYKPGEHWTFDATYRVEERDSNRWDFGYEAEIAAVGFTLTL